MCWDLGGQVGLRSIWDKYYSDSHAIIFVVDAADRSRFGDVRAEMGSLSCYWAVPHCPQTSYLPMLRSRMHQSSCMQTNKTYVGLHGGLRVLKSSDACSVWTYPWIDQYWYNLPWL